MSPDDVRAEVARIRQLAERDDEAAHSAEDALHQAVLLQLANEGSEIARIALETQAIDFERWCA